MGVHAVTYAVVNLSPQLCVSDEASMNPDLAHLSYHLVTLGCPKNETDSSGMDALLQKAHLEAQAQPEEADVIIVNTCGFLQEAIQESLTVLQTQAAHKRHDQTLIAAGCLAQRQGDLILQTVPEVDGLLGTRRWMDIVPLVRALRTGPRRRRQAAYTLLGDPTPEEPALARTVTGGSAYLKIADGCNAPCAFCTIPSFKGKLRSRPVDAVLAEAQQLVRAGARELIVVAQDTTDYGRDRNEPDGLAHLLRTLCRCSGADLQWLRLMYAYPGHVTPTLIETMAREEIIIPYLDIPLQHGDPATLRRMRRPSRLDMVFEHITQLRAAMPDIALRTTFIVGFPGETETEFANLLQFVNDIQFDRVGAFQFSPEPDTPSYTLPNPVADAVKEERWHQLMACQQSISLARNQAQIGRRLEVLIEGTGMDENSGTVLVGRSYRDAPEVDGLVLIPDAPDTESGSMVSVHITGALPYDLVGEVLTPLTFTTGPS